MGKPIFQKGKSKETINVYKLYIFLIVVFGKHNILLLDFNVNPVHFLSDLLNKCILLLFEIPNLFIDHAFVLHIFHLHLSDILIQSDVLKNLEGLDPLEAN